MGERIAVFSDVHGNTTALEAVYQDSIKQKVDKYWFLGDLFSPGPGAQDLWDLFKQINPEICIRGNWDDLFLNALRGVVDTDRTSLVYISKLAQNLDIYKLQLVTGKVHTHDHELMKKINDERGYLNDVIKFNEKVRKKG